MIYRLADLTTGFEISADAVVVGSGAGGAVAAANLAAAGLETVVVEAGPQIGPAEMTRDAPSFVARYYWDAGMRMSTGSNQVPVMQGRVLGGSTVVNSAIMFELPEWVRQEWIEDFGLDSLREESWDAALARVFARTKTTTTPDVALGRHNRRVIEALSAAGLTAKPLPRAVVNCGACGDCITGCHAGHKMSVDRCYLPDADRDNAGIYTCCEVDRVRHRSGRAEGVSGWVVDPQTNKRLSPFAVRAPRVLLAAGAVNTPVLLLRSGLDNGKVGRNLAIHLTSGCAAVGEEITDPWVGATQGAGAICEDIRGLKYEALWAPPSLLAARQGGIAEDFYEQAALFRRSTIVVLVFRGQVTGRVRPGFWGRPHIQLWMRDEDMRVLQLGLKRAVDGLLATGNEYVTTYLPGIPQRIRTAADAETLLTTPVRTRDFWMSGNHIFCSTRMSADANRGAVNANGELNGSEGIYVVDASILPTPTAVNPQATIMALADLITRRLADLPLGP